MSAEDISFGFWMGLRRRRSVLMLRTEFIVPVVPLVRDVGTILPAVPVRFVTDPRLDARGGEGEREFGSPPPCDVFMAMLI